MIRFKKNHFIIRNCYAITISLEKLKKIPMLIDIHKNEIMIESPAHEAR